MNTVTLRQHFLEKPGATEDFPFGPEVAVFKVGGKMFALVPTDAASRTLSLKCDPDDALALRAMYPDAVQPGYHLNKRHWNTITLDETVPEDVILDMIEQSYQLVFGALTRAVRNAIAP
ncbi:MAG: MmcQ/YjbR family DNA-binding protein [Armatimonadota bacterium]|nr:MmcQ/YjbR family DNA-binding protein [Armatimonadota bacterium]